MADISFVHAVDVVFRILLSPITSRSRSFSSSLAFKSPVVGRADVHRQEKFLSWDTQ